MLNHSSGGFRLECEVIMARHLPISISPTLHSYRNLPSQWFTTNTIHHFPISNRIVGWLSSRIDVKIRNYCNQSTIYRDFTISHFRNICSLSSLFRNIFLQIILFFVGNVHFPDDGRLLQRAEHRSTRSVRCRSLDSQVIFLIWFLKTDKR